VLWKYMTFNGAIQFDGASNSAAVRILVVRDTQQIADTAPSGSDLFETTGPFSLINNQTAGRFKILYDKVWTQDNSIPLEPIKFTVKNSHHVRFNGTSTTDPQKGGVWLMVVSNKPSTNQPVLAGSYRVCFYDN